MVGLLDVNVLVALLVPEHQHHNTSIEWFAAEGSQGWATCAVTELGVIRVCAQLPMAEIRTTIAPKQITDRYLLGLARRHGGRVITLDRGLAAAGGDDVNCLLPPGA